MRVMTTGKLRCNSSTKNSTETQTDIHGATETEAEVPGDV